MYLEFADNNGRKYIRVCESVRVLDPVSHKHKTKKITIKNIGPVSRFDDGLPDFIPRLKASFLAGDPLLEELRPFVPSSRPFDTYNIKLLEGTDDCIAHPRSVSNLLFEKILEDLDLSQLIRSYKNRYDISFDVYGFFKLLLFGRILNPASKWATVKQNTDYAFPVMKGDWSEFQVYDALDFIFEHRHAFFNRINSSMVSRFGRTARYVYYDVTNFFFEIDDPDEDVLLPDGETMDGFRKNGVSKEHRPSPLVQMGLLMDEQGIPISIECFPGNTLDHQTLASALEQSADSLPSGENRFVYVCDKGVGKGESIVYALSHNIGYLTSRSVRGASKAEKDWILDPDGYISLSDSFRYKTRIVKKKTTTPEGIEIEYPEKVLTYWSKKYFDREFSEKQHFYEFVQAFLKDPHSFRISSSQIPLIRKYLRKDVLNRKTGELLDSRDISALLDVDKLKREYDLLGYYTLATSEIHMDDREILHTYGNLVEIEEQFHVLKSTLEARPVFVRSKEHIIAHLTICTIALILLRLIQRQIKLTHPEAKDSSKLFCDGLSADRIQAALNKWKVERLGDTYFRFCDTDDPDLSLILDSFGIDIPKKCFKTNEVKQLKSMAGLSM